MAELRHELYSATELDELRRQVAALSQDNRRLRDTESLHQLQLDELHHRLKNTLAAAHSIALHTWQADPRDFPESLAGRLRAYERSLSLRDGEGRSADIASIFRFELEPYAGPDIGHHSLEGPELVLGKRAAAALAMAAHELVTNAAKYGALSIEDGTVTVSWRLIGHDGGQRLRLSWTESDGPEVHPPERRGFGSRLLEQALAGELNGEVRLSFPPQGVRCDMDLPWDQIGAVNL